MTIGIEVRILPFTFLLRYELNAQAMTIGIEGVCNPSMPVRRPWTRPVIFGGDFNLQAPDMKGLNNALPVLEKAGVKVADAWIAAGSPKDVDKAPRLPSPYPGPGSRRADRR